MVAGFGSPDAGRAPVARAEVLAGFGQTAGVVVDAARVTEAKRLLDLRAKQPQEQGNWGRNAVDRISAQRKGERWSVNMASEDKKAFKDKTTSKEASAKIEKAQVTLAALEILNMPAGPQRVAKLAEMKANKIIPSSITTEAQLENAAISYLAADPYIADMLEDIPVAIRTGYIQRVFMSGTASQELQRSLAQRMGEAHALILGLPQTQTESEVLKTQLDQAESLRDVAKERCQKLIEQKFSPARKLSNVEKAKLDAALQTSDQNNRRYELTLVIGEALGIPPGNGVAANEYVRNDDRIQQLDREILALNKKSAEYKAKNTEKTNLVTRNGALTAANGNIQNEVILYKQALQLTGETGFRAAEGTYTTQNTQVNTLELQAKASAGAQISYERFSAENEALGKLDSAFGEAMADVMQVQEDKIREAKVIEQQAKEKAAEGQVKKDLMQLHATENKRWIEADTKNKNDVVHIKNISSDARILAYYGEQGARILIARDAGIINQADFNHYITVDSKTMSPEQYLESSLSAANKTRLTTIFTPEQAKEYRDNLMTKYFTAQRYMKEGVFGYALRFGRGISIDGNPADRANFQLKENEWTRLYTNFESEITDALDHSTAAKGFLDQLKAQGIVAEPKLKWLAYLLFILLGIGGVGSGLIGPAAGIGIAGAGVAGEKIFNKSAAF